MVVTLDRRAKDEIEYARVERQSAQDLKNALPSLRYSSVNYSYLADEHRWTLLSPSEQSCIRKIEGQVIQIRQFIKTGIATLRDGAYLVEKTNTGTYEKEVGGTRFEIEPSVVRQIYKISDVDSTQPVHRSVKYIIFPYRRTRAGKHEIIPEETFRAECPGAYACLMAQRESLDERDKGKPNPVAWYAYGRTQGINFYGRKLIYPTFSNVPKFTLLDDEGALFCNGYALFASDIFPMDVLQKVLNSSIMRYYVNKTSYPIEGGFMCYQKKYIERFSVPMFSSEELDHIRAEEDRERLDAYLLQKYELPAAVLR